MKFSDTPGQSLTKQLLRDMASAGRIHHCILISGNSGLGKMNIARTFAQYLHCDSPTGGEPCGVCPSCRQHESLSHPDLHFVFPVLRGKKPARAISEDYLDLWSDMLHCYPFMPEEKWLEILNAGQSKPAIFVDESAEIVRKASLSAFREKYKIFIIWLPERMRTEAANKLLKIIEEPFADTLFILVSNRPDEILPTITSRSLPVRVQRAEECDIRDFLSNNLGMDEMHARIFARLADGSPGKAIILAEHPEETTEFRETFQEMMRMAYSRKVGSLKTLGDSIAGMGREKSARFFDYCCRMVRENFIFNIKDPRLNIMSEPEENFSIRFSPFIHHGNVEQLNMRFEEAKNDILRNANAKIVLFDLMLYLIPLIRMPKP